jgi:hypothetical protein
VREVEPALASGPEEVYNMRLSLLQSISSSASRPDDRFLLVLAIALWLYYVVSSIVLHVLERRTNPIRYSLSHYASTPHRRVAQVQMIAKTTGLASLAAFLFLNYSFLHGGSLTLLASALVGLLAPLFSINENRRPFRASDYIHIAIAAVTFFLLVTAMNTITSTMTGAGLLTLPGFAGTLVTLSYDLLIAFAVCFLLPPLRRVSGLAERLFVATTLAWLFLISFLLL